MKSKPSTVTQTAMWILFPRYISIRCEWLLYGSASPTMKSFISNSLRESSCTGLGRGSKLRSADLLSNVLLCLLSSCYLNRSTITNQLLGIRDGSMMLSHRNLVYLTLQTFLSHAAALFPWIAFHMRSSQCKFSKPIN